MDSSDAGGGSISDASTSDVRVPLSCESDFSMLRLEWPMTGVEGRDWVLRNYVDLDENASGLRDYRGATGDDAKTYDGHRGVDISLANFRAMEAGHEIVSATDGVVEEVLDVHDDRSTAFFSGCGDFNNRVTVRRSSGIRIRYLHIRTGSALVGVGERVSAGQPLATVGSAGCSTWPHLHFDITDCSGDRVSPFEHGMWADPPAYTAPLGLMDIVLRDARIDAVSVVRDAGPDPERFDEGGAFSLALVLAAGTVGEPIEVRVLRGDASVFDTFRATNDREYTRSVRWWNRTLDGPPGDWEAIVSFNGIVADSVIFPVQ